LDEVYEDLTREQSRGALVRREVDPDLPGLGNFYCIACSRYFCSQAILDEHTNTKGHKRKCELLAKV
jgi:bud site selection protein 20